MIYAKALFTVTTLIIFLRLGESLNLAGLVQTANIYYQQPLQGGKPLEFPLSVIEDVRSKTDFKIIIHGFLGNRFHNSIRPLGHAYMSQGVENVFLADWKDAAKLDYYSSRKAVGDVAMYLAKKLEEFFKKHDILLSEVHIIGHSLGAHIAGNIGRYFKGSLGRITGLDPALPLFSPKSPDSLQSNAALFVDVIHTDYPVFGDITPRGTVDFYPNYGYTPQRGCDNVNLLTASKLVLDAYSCSHNRAVILYAESIGLPKNFPTIPCSFNTIRRHNSSMCLQKGTALGLTKASLAEAIKDENQDVVVYMGEYVSRRSTGIYYLATYDTPPFGMGVYTQVDGL